MYRHKHVLDHLGHNLWSANCCRKLRFAKLALPLAFCLMFAGSIKLPAFADAAEDAVAKLEIKFFSHDYPKDPIAARLDRLEKMVFGESKTGDTDKRLSSLLAVVPGSKESTETTSEETAQKPQASDRTPLNPAKETADYAPPSSSKYPAVTAIEQRMFGKDFAAEPINQRLERLETKVYGKVSASDDLSYRVDRLKDRTGIDIVKQATQGSDWADEDADQNAEAGQVTPMASNDDQPAFNNSRRNLQRTFGTPQGAGGGWPYPQSQGRIPQGSPAPGPSYAGAPPLAPDYQNHQQLGLNQQVASLEKEIYGKTYAHEALPARLSRLEQTVFPEQPPAQDMPLPQRVKKLLAVIPLSQPNPSIAQSRSEMQQNDPDPNDMPNPYQQQAPSNYQSRQPRSGSGGLSKIIGSIGNFITGGPMGGSPAQGGMVQDPQTGLLYNQATGTLVDPITGAVVGQRATPYYGGGGSYQGFNNGFAPMGGGTGFGIGGGGMRFGMGGPGGGMWP